MDQSTITENIRQIKRRFFAMRNGAIGEQMRRNGLMYRINFGLNLPQIREIAADFPHDADLASALWANTTTRESMLIAPMLLPDDARTAPLAWQWACEAPTVEIADILCLTFIQRLPEVKDIIDRCLMPDEQREIVRYIGLRLIRGMAALDGSERYIPIVKDEMNSERSTSTFARLVLFDLDLDFEG